MMMEVDGLDEMILNIVKNWYESLLLAVFDSKLIFNLNIKYNFINRLKKIKNLLI